MVRRLTESTHSPNAVAAALELGRSAFERRVWSEAYSHLSAADRAVPLNATDLARLAGAAHLVGRTAESDAAWDRAHHAARDAGDVPAAVRAAFWLSLGLLVRGNVAHATGWTARGLRLLDESREDCVERGYLRFTEALRHGIEGNAPTAARLFAEAVAIATRFSDPNLVALARHAEARALIFGGDTRRGASLLDETLIAIEAGEVSPLFVGDIYCSAISACHEMYDLGRVHEWTVALNRWCETQPEAIPYRGQCLIHRAELIRLQGDWDAAALELERAREWLEQPPMPAAIGNAWYLIGELHRMRGALDAADAAFRQASRVGHDPQPGLGLLRLAQGNAAAAQASIRRALEEEFLWPRRARLLPALIEISLGAGDPGAATAACDELAALAERARAPLLSAAAAYAAGSLALAEGDARTGLTSSRQSAATWRELRVPYETARARVLIGRCCRALGDEEGGMLELEAAREAFERLGAKPDVARVDALLRRARPAPNAGLTGREAEVLRLIAKGQTNRGIATTLRISEKTVARHVSNIFVKLRVTNRAAATTYAHEHDLLERT